MSERNEMGLPERRSPELAAELALQAVEKLDKLVTEKFASFEASIRELMGQGHDDHKDIDKRLNQSEMAFMTMNTELTAVKKKLSESGGGWEKAGKIAGSLINITIALGIVAIVMHTVSGGKFLIK